MICRFPAAPSIDLECFAVLTPAGRNALRRAWPVYREAIRRHLSASLSAQQCRELTALLEQAAARTDIRLSRS